MDTIKMTKEQALAAGYERYGYDGEHYQSVHLISHLKEDDFKDNVILAAEKESYYSPTIDAEDIRDFIADTVQEQCHGETGDDTDEVYEIVAGMDLLPFSTLAGIINIALSQRQYWKLTNIEIIPDNQ